MNISLRRIWDTFIKEVERRLIKLYLITIARLMLNHITPHCFKIMEWDKANKNLSEIIRIFGAKN